MRVTETIGLVVDAIEKTASCGIGIVVSGHGNPRLGNMPVHFRM